MNQYLPLAKEDPYIQIIVEGLIRRDIKWVNLDPYGSSYRLLLDFDHMGKTALTEWYLVVFVFVCAKRVGITSAAAPYMSRNMTTNQIHNAIL